VRRINNWTQISEDYGAFSGTFTILVCPNPQCRKLSISAQLDRFEPQCMIEKENFASWELVPESNQKPLPDYIPQQLRNDYSEACLTCNKSPRASAALSRRCLQGMIRDFWKIAQPRLIDEINELEAKVDRATWSAIDSVRKFGNLGAHLEKDASLILDVDPAEANMLIRLIETLFEEWHIKSREREVKMQKLIDATQQPSFNELNACKK
jgi:hypothetical protein